MNKKKRNIIAENTFSLGLLGSTGAIMLSSNTPLIRSLGEYSAHLMLGMLAASIFFMLLDKRTIMFASLACTAALALWLKNASNTDLKLPVINQEVKLKVAHVNLSNVDDRLDELVGIMEEENVDVISFQELTPDWTQLLRDELSMAFPHRTENVRIDPYGIALYSKYPMKHQDTILADGIPSVCLEIENGGEVFHVISSYLTPALDSKSIEKATSQLSRIKKEIQEKGDRVIALGEYNMVYWAQEIREFRSDTKLKNSRRDISQGNLRVPYDHIFFTEDLECTNFSEIIGNNQKYLGILGMYQIKSDRIIGYHSSVSHK